MPDYLDEIDNALLGDTPISREKVVRWIDADSDLTILAKLYRLTGEAYYRIQPDLGRDESCALIQRYLLQCIREGLSDSEEIQGRYEAAQSLHVWFCHLLDEGHVGSPGKCGERCDRALPSERRRCPKCH